MKHINVMGLTLESKNGKTRVVSELSLYFKDKLTIFTEKYKPEDTFEISSSTKIWEIPHSTNVLLNLLQVNRLLHYIKIARIIRKDGFQDIVINTHSSTFIIVASLIKLLLFNKKVRVSSIIYDWSVVKNELIPQENQGVVKKLKQIPKTLRFFSIKLLIKIGVVDELIVWSDEIKQFLCKLFDTNNVQVIRVGISQSFIKRNESNNLSPSEKLKKSINKEDKIKLFFQGRPIPEKRIEDIITALSLLIKDGRTDISLYVGGLLIDVEYASRLQRITSDLHLNNKVHFLGGLSEEELMYLYNECDIVLFPCYQIWGLAPLEAMAFKKPVIVSTDCGVSEVLNENVAIIVPPKNPEAIKDAILKLIDNKDLREELGSNAQDYVLKNLMFSNTGDALKKLWEVT